jgi:hypothetical protein
MHERHAIAEPAQCLARDGQRVGVAIDPDQPRRPAFEQHPRMTRETDRAVDENTATLRLQERPYFVDENRNVRRFQLDSEV